jgi:hypothetical protein
VETADKTGIDESTPVTMDLVSIRTGLLQEDGAPVLIIRADGAGEVRVVVTGDHQEDRAGLRRLMDGVSALQYEVMSQELTDGRQAREATTAQEVVDADAVIAAEARIAELRGPGPSLSGAY